MSESARQLSYAKALNEGLDVCMSRDERVFLIGLGAPDPNGEFGTPRVWRSATAAAASLTCRSLSDLFTRQYGPTRK